MLYRDDKADVVEGEGGVAQAVEATEDHMCLRAWHRVAHDHIPDQQRVPVAGLGERHDIDPVLDAQCAQRRLLTCIHCDPPW